MDPVERLPIKRQESGKRLSLLKRMGGFLWAGAIVAFYLLERVSAELPHQSATPSAARNVSQRSVTPGMEQALCDLAGLGESRLTFAELGARIDEILQKITHLPNLFICLIEEDPPRIRFVYCRDEYDRHVDRPIDGLGLTDRIYLTGKSLLLRRPQANALLETGNLVNHGVPSLVWLGVPLRSGGRILGAMATQDYENADALNEDNEACFLAVAPLIAGLVDRVARWTDAGTRDQREREAQKQKQALFATIGHDVRSPLAVIQGYTDLLGQTLKDSPAGVTAGRIAKAACALSSATDRLLDYSSTEAGATEAVPATTELGGWKRSLESWTRTTGTALKVAVETDMRVGDRDCVRVDAVRLRQMLQHLLRVAFVVDGVERVRLSLRVQPVVTIPDGMLRLAFSIEAFEAADASGGGKPDTLKLTAINLADGRTYDGMTVSLAIAKRLAEKVAGEVKVSVGYEAPWRASLVLTVPAVGTELAEFDDRQRGAMALLQAQLQQQPSRMVVIDSDSTSRAEMVELVAETTGATPQGVASAAEWMSECMTEEICVIIVAVEAGAAALTAVSAALAHDVHSVVPPYVIAVSHDQTPVVVESMLDGGADAYLPRPLNAAALLVALSKAWLEHEQRLERIGEADEKNA